MRTSFRYLGESSSLDLDEKPEVIAGKLVSDLARAKSPGIARHGDEAASPLGENSVCAEGACRPQPKPARP